MQFGVALAIAWLYATNAVLLIVHLSSSTSISLREEMEFALSCDKLDAEDTFSAVWQCTYIQFVEDLVSCDRIH